jgi:hypothetical protein
MWKTFFKDRIITFVGLVIIVVYLFVNFTTINQAILFLAVVFLFVFSIAFFDIFFRKVLVEKASISNAIRSEWAVILLLTSAILVVYFLAGWRLLSALLLGMGMFASFIGVYYLLKRSARK